MIPGVLLLQGITFWKVPHPPDNRTNDTSIDINDSAVGTYLSSPLDYHFFLGQNTEPSTINPTTEPSYMMPMKRSHLEEKQTTTTRSVE